MGWAEGEEHMNKEMNQRSVDNDCDNTTDDDCDDTERLDSDDDGDSVDTEDDSVDSAI